MNGEFTADRQDRNGSYSRKNESTRMVTECCPGCMEEAEIPAGTISPCPSCGLRIKPCDECEYRDSGGSCGECPLGPDAEEVV